jgi:hypothetical protein
MSQTLNTVGFESYKKKRTKPGANTRLKEFQAKKPKIETQIDNVKSS